MTYMDNEDTYHRRSYRVLATYRSLVSDYLGMSQVVLAFVIIVTAIIGFAVDVIQAVSVTSFVLASLVSSIHTCKHVQLKFVYLACVSSHCSSCLVVFWGS